MAAGTEGFRDTSQPGRDHIGDTIAKILAARRLAQEERERAEQIAEDNQTSLEEAGIGRGFFFKAALGHEFGGDFIASKKEDIGNLKKKAELLKDPKNFWDVVEGKGVADIKKKSAVDRFRDKLGGSKYGLEIDDPLLRPRSAWPREPMVPDTEKETSDAVSGRKGRVSREDILSAITKIAESLERTAQSISQTAQENSNIASNIISMQREVVSQISERTSTIEDKLDAIISAINNQTNFEKQTIDQAETASAESRSEGSKDVATNEMFNDATTDKDDLEVTIRSIIQEQNEETADDQAPPKPPEAETGGIISGPDSGYNVKLHGDEMVIPLNNAFTDPSKPAVTEKGRKMEQSGGAPRASRSMKSSPSPKQSFETGTKPPTTSSLGSKIGFTSLPMLGTASTGSIDKLSQPLMDAMSLPMMVAGGTVLSATTKYMNTLGPDNLPIANEIARATAPIADVFGLPNTLANKAKDTALLKSEEEDKQQQKSDKKTGMFGKFLSVLSKIVSGSKSGGAGAAPPPAAGPMGPADFSGEGASQAMNFFQSQGLTKEQAAGIVGNLAQESGAGLDPMANNGTHRGIAQWDANRWGQFEVWAKSKGLNVNTREAQLMWIMEEMRTGSGGLGIERFKKQTTAEGAAALFLSDFERSGEKAGSVGYENRMRNARQLASMDHKPAGSGPNGKPLNGLTSASQAITQNFGFKTGEKLNFVYNNEQYHGYKTTNGWDIYKNGPLGVGTLVQTSGGKNSAIVKALIQAGKTTVQQRNTAVVRPPDRQGTGDQASLRPAPKTGSSKDQVAVINTGARANTSGTSAQPTSERQLTASATNLQQYYGRSVT